VYDVADVFKFDTVVPVAFKVAGEAERRSGPAAADPVGAVRRGCRDAFRRTGLLDKIIPAIEEMLAYGGLPVPEAPADSQPVAISETQSGDPGHRG
jgi:CRISPR-associated protein Cas1